MPRNEAKFSKDCQALELNGSELNRSGLNGSGLNGSTSTSSILNGSTPSGSLLNSNPATQALVHALTVFRVAREVSGEDSDEFVAAQEEAWSAIHGLNQVDRDGFVRATQSCRLVILAGEHGNNRYILALPGGMDLELPMVDGSRKYCASLVEIGGNEVVMVGAGDGVGTESSS